MTASSVLFGLAGTLGVFAVAAGLIWLTFRGVERSLTSGRESRLVTYCLLLVSLGGSAAMHIADGDWWSYFLVAVAVLYAFLIWREWRRERA